jgi:hypothetical protein
MPDDEPLQLSLDMPDVGSLKVIWAPEDGAWFWQLENAQGRILQGGMNLQVAGKHSAQQAMKVLIQFLLTTADKPVADFYQAVTVWAVANREELAKALKER